MKKKGLWIPIEVLELNDISTTSKMILAEIMQLSKLKSGCTQTDKKLAEMFGISMCGTSRIIKALCEKKYIEKKTEYSSFGPRRVITVTIQSTVTIPSKVMEPTIQSTVTIPSKVQSHTIRNKNTKKKNNINTILPAVGNEPTLYKSIESAFLSKTGKFTNYPKEGKSIKGLIEKAENWAPDNPGGFIKDMITRFYEMRKEDKFIGKQPFTPSALNSGWLFDRVMIPLENHQDEIPADLEFLFEEPEVETGNIHQMG